MTPTFPADLPHADLLARVRAAAGASGRMANALRADQFREIVASHPDVVAMDARGEED